MTWLFSVCLGLSAFAYGWNCDAAHLRSRERVEVLSSDDDQSTDIDDGKMSIQSPQYSKQWSDCESTLSDLCPAQSNEFARSQCIIFNAPSSVITKCDSYLQSIPSFNLMSACMDEIDDFCDDVPSSETPNCLQRAGLYLNGQCSDSLRMFQSHASSEWSHLHPTEVNSTVSYMDEFGFNAISSSGSLRASIEKVHPLEGGEDEAVDFWGLMELFFGNASNDPVLDLHLDHARIDENDVDENDELLSTATTFGELSLYSQFLQFAEYMFSSMDDEESLDFDDENKSQHLRYL